MMFFKIKTQISNLVSLNHIHFLYIYIGYTYHSYHQIRVLAATANSWPYGDPTDPTKRGFVIFPIFGRQIVLII